MKWPLLAGCLTFYACVGTVRAEPLPDPLTLEQALSLSRQGHPALLAASADVQKARARLAGAEAISGTRISLLGRLQAVEPPTSFDFENNNDSSIHLNLEKRLYDFGHSKAAQDAASLALTGSEWLQLDARQQHYLSVMKAFLDVVLADLEYARDNEAMATAYVSWDRARDRQQLGQVSDIALLEKETQYQKARRKRFASEARQRATRSRLAIALNRPDELPANLISPEPPDLEATLPEMEELTRSVLAENPRVKGLRAELQSAQQGVEQAKTRYGPVLHGELEAADYQRLTRSTFPFRAALVLEVPLYTGGLSDARVAEALAMEEEKRAALGQAELELRQSVLDLWLELDTLRIRMQELQALDDYRDLYLDRSRTLYELEVTADLGDAMVQTSEVRLLKAQTRFQWMLARARLDALAGRLLPEHSGDIQ